MMNLEKLIELYQKGDYDNCFLACEQLLLSDPDNFDILSYYGSCLLKRKLFDEAIKIFNKSLSQQKLFFLYTFRGDCYYGLEKYDLAANDYKKSIQLNPNVGATWDNAARAYYKLGDINEAYRCINKAIELSEGEEYDPLTIKAIFLKLEGRTAESFKLLVEIRKKFPGKEFLRKQQFEIIEKSFRDDSSKNRTSAGA